MSIRSHASKQYLENLSIRELISDAAIAIQIKKTKEPTEFDIDSADEDIENLKDFLREVRDYLVEKDTKDKDVEPLADRILKEKVGRDKSIEFVNNTIQMLEEERWDEADDRIDKLKDFSDKVSTEKKRVI